MFGMIKTANSKKIRRFNIEGVAYRYFAESSAKNASNKEAGFISAIRGLFYDNNVVVRDRKVILQILVPSGVWYTNRQNEILRYSDISVGWSSRGKIKVGEQPANASRRETFEEIDLMIPRREKHKITYVRKWGRIHLYKFDMTGCNIRPVNPFV
jgi:hypothetical protein